MFRATMTLDRTRRLVTLCVGSIVGVAAGAALVAPAAFPSRGGIPPWAVVGPVLAIVVLAFAWAMSPCGVVVDGGELRVERRAWPPLRFPLSAIAGVSIVDSPARGAVRLFGVGGFFGSYGLFSSSALGRFRMYATRGGPGVVVRRKGGDLPIVFTPDDAAATVHAMSAFAMLARAP